MYLVASSLGIGYSFNHLYKTYKQCFRQIRIDLNCTQMYVKDLNCIQMYVEAFQLGLLSHIQI